MADIHNKNNMFASVYDVNNNDAIRTLQNHIHDSLTVDFEINDIHVSIINQDELIDELETQSGTGHIGGHSARIDFSRDGNETLAHSMFNTQGWDPIFPENVMSGSDILERGIGSIEKVEISPISEGFAIEGNTVEHVVNLSAISTNDEMYAFKLTDTNTSLDDHSAPQFSNGVVYHDETQMIMVPAETPSFSVFVASNDDSIDELNENDELTISNKIAKGHILDNDETHVSISIDPITGDNIISAIETKTDIKITGVIGGDAQQGDSVILSVHSKTFSAVAELENGSLVYNIWVPGQDLVADNDTKIEASISIFDASAMAVSATAQSDYQVAPVAVDDPLGGLKGEYWGYVQNSWHKDWQGKGVNTDCESEKSYFFEQSYYNLSGIDKEAKLAEFEAHQIQYGRQENLTNIAQVQDYINHHDVEINFVSTAVDYQKSPYSSSNLADNINAEGVPSNLAYFLNNDAVSITGTSTELATDGIMRLSGSLSLQHSGIYKFEISHDDGYQIKIDGISVSEFGANSSVIISGNEIALEAGGHGLKFYIGIKVTDISLI